MDPGFLFRNIDVERHFQQYCIYIVTVSFIDGGNRKYRDKTTDLKKKRHSKKKEPHDGCH